MPDGFELFFCFSVEDWEGGFTLVVGVAGHFGAGGDAGGVVHPLMIEVGAEALVGEVEIDAGDFESVGGVLIADGVASDAAKAFVVINELFSDGCELVIWFRFLRRGWRDAVLVSEASGKDFGGPVCEGWHASKKPGARTGVGGSG